MRDSGCCRSPAWYRQRIRTLEEKHCTTAAQLNATLAELARLHVGEMRAAIAARIMAGFERLRQETPKDTGRARAGWQISGNAGVTEYVPPVVSKPDGKESTADGDDILPEYAAMIRETVPDGAELTESDVISIVNNVEYIMMLEAGWAGQAPRGFIGNFLTTLRREMEALAAMYRREG